jgi:hypothetical protein
MVPSSQDIFFEWMVIQRLIREGAAIRSAFVQKRKPALLPDISS